MQLPWKGDGRRSWMIPRLPLSRWREGGLFTMVRQLPWRCSCCASLQYEDWVNCVRSLATGSLPPLLPSPLPRLINDANVASVCLLDLQDLDGLGFGMLHPRSWCRWHQGGGGSGGQRGGNHRGPRRRRAGSAWSPSWGCPRCASSSSSAASPARTTTRIDARSYTSLQESSP
jgi:hypothetical protein